MKKPLTLGFPHKPSNGGPGSFQIRLNNPTIQYGK